MIYYIYPKADTTIYEYQPLKNTGLDSILEISKYLHATSSLPSSSKMFSSRVLLQFDVSKLRTLLPYGYNLSSSNNLYNLKLMTTEVVNRPTNYTLQVNKVFDTWTPGIGKFDYVPYISEGASWKYTTGLNAATTWSTSNVNTTRSFVNNEGGGNWYTGSKCSQSFSGYETSDTNINVTNIFHPDISTNTSSLTVIVKRDDSEEYTTADTGVLQFYSIDTHTIYLPKLKVSYIDSIYQTGSSAIISSSAMPIVYFTNLKEEYNVNEIPYLYLNVRPKYPPKTFATSSNYSFPKYVLPQSASYSVYDVQTRECVIDSDWAYTAISSNGTQNYFRFCMNVLQPERYYKLVINVDYTTEMLMYDNSFIFKVVS